MLSLYDYLGKPAGSALGKKVYEFAKTTKAKTGTKIVSSSPYKDGTIITYEKEFLDKYFEKSVVNQTTDDDLPF